MSCVDLLVDDEYGGLRRWWVRFWMIRKYRRESLSIESSYDESFLSLRSEDFDWGFGVNENLVFINGFDLEK